MAIKIPEEPKVYTTVYDNFKGVDFTNDMSNIWKRRSPDGVNMLPDLDGRPYKRTGWEIHLTPSDFRNAAGITDESIEVVPDKVYYFEIGGYDFLIIFNNLGVFSYTTNPLSHQESIFPYLLVHLDTYIDTAGHRQSFPPSVDGSVLPIDSRRAFFFEGKGIAGFYLFVGLKLFRYDGAYFNEVDPYTPVTLISCDPTGAGTFLEAVNMLTPKRIIQYTGDGTTLSYNVPNGIDPSTALVEVMGSDGAWHTATGYTITEGRIDFATAPEVVIEGEDNIRVTYIPDGAGAIADEKNVDLNEKTVYVCRTRTQRRTKVDSGTPSAWADTKTVFSYGGETFETPNIKTNATTKAKSISYQCRNAGDTAWETMSDNKFKAEWNAYGDNVTVTPSEAMYTSSTPTTKTSTTTGKESAWKKYGSYKTTTTKTVKKKKKKVTVTHYRYEQTRTVVDYKYYRIKASYTQYIYRQGGSAVNESVTAFTQCTRTLVFGSGIINQVFLSASPYPAYSTRVWYSSATDPSYFPDTNYIEVGSTDTPIMGMMKVGEYLGVIKQGVSTDTSIYLAYPTSFDDDTTYAVKQNVNGIGAISNGAFNILNEEPLFLSARGVMGIEVSTEDTDRQLRNRSYFVNKRLCADDNLSQAISFVHDGMYYLAVNGHCYVLDGSQKNSWANTKTNLQYECYFLDNIPAQCFCRFNDELWFTDFKGNVCRFKGAGDSKPYHDDYSIYDPDRELTEEPIDMTIPYYEGAKIGDLVTFNGKWYTVTNIDGTLTRLGEGVPVKAIWSTLMDDDGMTHYFKNLYKKGTMVSLLPESDSGVKIYIKADNNEPVYIGETDAKDYELPFDFYVKKKIKKYKRLQIICENDVLDDSFGIDQIIKCYSVGNYSKNRG
jgi:hypothetical protein